MGVGIKLDDEDLRRVTDLWDNIINPTCIKWAQETGKPAEAYREAVVGVLERQVTKFNPWNAWQRIWWHQIPNNDDGILDCIFLSQPFHIRALTPPCSGVVQDVSVAISSKTSNTEGRRASWMDARA